MFTCWPKSPLDCCSNLGLDSKQRHGRGRNWKNFLILKSLPFAFHRWKTGVIHTTSSGGQGSSLTAKYHPWNLAGPFSPRLYLWAPSPTPSTCGIPRPPCSLPPALILQPTGFQDYLTNSFYLALEGTFSTFIFFIYPFTKFLIF